MARLNQDFEFQILNPEFEAEMLVNNERLDQDSDHTCSKGAHLLAACTFALRLQSVSPAGAVTEGAAVSQTPRRVPADVLGCLLVGAVDQEDRMVSRYVAARED